MISQLLAAKPKSIFEIIPMEFFSEMDGYNYYKTGNYYEWMYALSAVIRPTSYLEIGVRYGFSFLPVLLGSPNLRTATGWDLETYGDNKVSRKRITDYYTGTCQWQIDHVNSQEIRELPQFYSLINIDGDHTVEGKMHDLRLTIGKCNYVIVDDFDYLVDVRKAVNAFLYEVGSDGWGKESRIDYAVYLPTFRGSMLIKYKDSV
jgi:hypothetical protein